MLMLRTTLLALFAVAFAVNVSAQSSKPLQQPRPIQSNRTPPAQETAQDQRGTEQRPPAVKILPTANAEAQAAQAEQREKERANTDKRLADETQRLADYTRILTIITGFVFAAAIGQIALFFWQLRLIAAESISNRANFIAGRRAWVSIESVKLKPDTKITEEGIFFGVEVLVKNLGQTPAMGVWVETESYFMENNPETFADGERRFKNTLRTFPGELGHILFPGDTLTQGYSWSDGVDKIKNSIRTAPTGEKKIGFNIFVGVRYGIVGETARHITYHAHGMLNVPIPTTLHQGQFIDLPPQIFLPGEAD